MPRETFFNLPEDKRSSITEAAVDEFAAYPFEQASVNRIVANAGIAKGSFYQYFEDKKDLFLYVMGVIAEAKIKYLSPVIQNPAKHDIFTVIREMFISGVQFALDQPRYAAIGNKLMADKQAPIYRALMSESRPQAMAFYEPLVKQAIARGEVRDDVDIEMLNYIIASMNVSIIEYCSENFPDTLYDAVADTVDAFMDFLKNGIGARAGSQQLEANS